MFPIYRQACFNKVSQYVVLIKFQLISDRLNLEKKKKD